MAVDMGRLLVGLLLAGGLALGLWLWTSSGERSAGAAGAVPSGGPAALPRSGALETSDEIQAPALPVPAAELKVASAPVDGADQRRALPATEGQRDDLVVRVVDPVGRPVVGIPLRLDPGSNDPGAALGPSERRVLERSGVELTTDSGGRAVFAGLRPILEAAAEPWTLRHGLPFEEPPALLLDHATLAADEVVSVLPAGGSIEVVAKDLAGAPAPDATEIELALIFGGDRGSERWKAETRGGRALFPWVELARTFELHAWAPGSTVPSRSRARGPATLGQRVEIEVVLGADHPIVGFRALDAGGVPLARVELRLLRKLFSFPVTTALETDAGGRFSVDADDTRFSEKGFVVQYRPDQDSLLCGRAEFPDGLVQGWNDGGDVLLASAPVLAAGWVVTESGQAVAGAEVVAASQIGDGANLRFFGDQGSEVKGRTDEQGRFELRGLLPDSEFELEARKESLRSKIARVQEGERAARLVLAASWTVSGALLVDPDLGPESVRIRLRESRQDPVEARVHSRSDEGRFALEPILAGVYDLVFSLEDQQLVELPGISVRADTDIGTVDLRGRTLRCEIVLLGAPEPGSLSSEITWRPSGSEGEWQSKSFQGSSVQLSSPVLPVDVWVKPHGYRRAFLERVAGRRELVLEAPLRVRLVLDTSGEFPALPYQLRCELMHDSDSIGEPDGARYFADENRELSFLVLEPGKTRVRWILDKSVEQRAKFEGGALSGTSTIAGDVLGGHELEIEVLDVPGEQVFPIELDGEALSALARKPPW